MPRPLRKKIKFDEDSVQSLFQEVYDDSFNIKAKIARLFTKWELKIKENVEIAAIGDQIVKLIAAEAKNQDQKIILLRYLKEVVFDSKNAGTKADDTETSKSTTSARRNEIIDMIQKQLEVNSNE